MGDLRILLQKARELGATEATAIATAAIVIDEDLAQKCWEPRCGDYGLAKSCPPHVGGPVAFRKLLVDYRQAVVLRIDVPTEALMPGRSRDVFRLLHEVASGVERASAAMGFTSAMAFAGGSCKAIFCHDHPGCPALAEGGTCRFPEYARPSMSGFGIDVAKLIAASGGEMNWVGNHSDTTTPAGIANVCGLVLIA